MRIDRRTFAGGLAATLATPFSCFAASITDATGRTVSGPDKITRVYPAGPRRRSRSIRWRQIC